MFRVSGIKARKAYDHMQDIISERPLDLNIETTTICPMKCRFCCNRLYERERQIMSNELFEKVIRQYCDMRGGTVGIGSMQSDFMSDPQLLERIDIINKYKKHLWLHSTTPLITAAKYSDEELFKILECFDFWVISAEGHDRESYLKMSGVDGFSTFYEQLKRIRKIIDENSLKIDIEVAFRTYERKKLVNSIFYREVAQTFYTSVMDSFFSWFGSIKESDLPEGCTLYLSDNSKKKVDCVVPSATFAVQANGKVIGCGCIDWLEQYEIGDVNKNTLKEIWNSQKALQFRHAFSKGVIPEICKECGLYNPLTCLRDKHLLEYDSKDGLYYWQGRRKYTK